MFSVSWVCFCLLWLVPVILSEDGVRVPPTIHPKGASYATLKEGLPVKPYHIYHGGGLTLPCYAEGVPPPSYRWWKDNEELIINQRNIRTHPDIRNGSIEIIELGRFDEGSYKCIAQNIHGAAVSRTFYLQQTKWTLGDTETLTYSGEEGKALRIPCRTSMATPRASVTWGLQKRQESTTHKVVTLDGRIIQDTLTHALFITHLSKEDRQLTNGQPLLYSCRVKNIDEDTTKGGGYSSVEVDDGDTSDKWPELLQSTKSPHVVVSGQDLMIQCIFKGRPSPDVAWKTVLPRVPEESQASALLISKVTTAHAGTYTCTGSNKMASSSASIEVRVETRPEFKHGRYPTDTFCTEGSDVTFFCEPTDATIPRAEITWHINAKNIDVEHPGERTEILADNTRFVVHKCRKSDIKVIQCKIDNKNGYGFASGFLNVLYKTQITRGPKSLSLEEDAEAAIFPCEATTDPYAEDDLKITWYRNGKTLEYHGDARLVDNGTALIVNLTGLDLKSKQHYDGTYSCTASTPYSNATNHVTLKIKTPYEEVPKAGIPWWIFIVLAVALVLIIFFVLCCCCLYQNGRGDSYPVDEKERLEGNDPEKELDDSGFHDFKRPEVEAVKGSRASLTSTVRMDTDEEASLASFGDMDMGRFNEDGSFIGQYKRKPSSAL